MGNGTEELLNSIWQIIEEIWIETGAWPDFIEAMQYALPRSSEAPDASRNLTKLALLPGLCCEAVGGNAHTAGNVTAAWIMFYIAADIMDKVEDADEPDPWWQAHGPGMAINVASGLFFSASKAMSLLLCDDSTRSAAPDIMDCFHDHLMIMCSGQHRDLVQMQPSLEQYWQNVSAKSGHFFQLACQAGARLATSDRRLISGYATYGYHLGVLIQILDDLEDIYKLQKMDLTNPSAVIQKSLALAYAREVLAEGKKERLLHCIKNINRDQSNVGDLIDILDEAGAVIYILAEIERHRNLGLEGLLGVSPQSKAGQKLVSIIQNISLSNEE